ncbi:hypothetical protein HDF11_001825 [Tunturiibacter psychrotolerans]
MDIVTYLNKDVRMLPRVRSSRRLYQVVPYQTKVSTDTFV